MSVCVRVAVFVAFLLRGGNLGDGFDGYRSGDRYNLNVSVDVFLHCLFILRDVRALAGCCSRGSRRRRRRRRCSCGAWCCSSWY